MQRADARFLRDGRLLGLVPDHVKILAVLSFAWAALSFVGGFQFFVATGFGFADTPGWMTAVAAAFMLLAVPALLAGAGLMQRRRWGRTFAFLTAALSLISIPLGTAYGIYAFVALRRPEIVATLG